MFEIEISRNFSAAHKLENYQGDCSKLHGHNWNVKVAVRVEKLDSLGIALDFRKLKSALDDILAELDHTNLNDIKEFKETNPTSEILAKYIYQKLSKILNTSQQKVYKVSVSESADSTASYFE